MNNNQNYDLENWHSLTQEESVSAESSTSLKAIFHKDNKDLLDDLYRGSGPNTFGGFGVVKWAYIEKSVDLLNKRVDLFNLAVEISDIGPGHSLDYLIVHPVVVNDSADSLFLELLEEAGTTSASADVKRLSSQLISKELYFDGERVELVSPEERSRILPLLCEAICDHRVFVNGKIAYSCVDQKQHFFLESIKFC